MNRGDEIEWGCSQERQKIRCVRHVWGKGYTYETGRCREDRMGIGVGMIWADAMDRVDWMNVCRWSSNNFCLDSCHNEIRETKICEYSLQSHQCPPSSRCIHLTINLKNFGWFCWFNAVNPTGQRSIIFLQLLAGFWIRYILFSLKSKKCHMKI